MPVRISVRVGFTLLELMIAVSLGMLIVLTAFAGLRTVSQAITKSKALSLENALLRTGMQMALEEADFWTNSDDPEKLINDQPLRAISGGAGMAFTPFRNANNPIVAGSPFIDNRPGLDELPGSPRSGWNPNPLAWAAWDARTWVRANIPETHALRDHGGKYQYWGTFGIYENLDPRKSWHHWYGGQVLGLIDALGFYGMHDYMPTNSFFVYHTYDPLKIPKLSRSTGLSWGGCPISLLRNDDWWGCQDGSDNTMKGRVRNSNGGTYFLPGPKAATPVKSRELAKIGYEGRDSGFNPKAFIPQFLASCGPTESLLAAHPEHWSNVTYSVQRYFTRAQYFAVCTVDATNPITGERLSFSFSTVCTTLRGARQQRLPTTGWADPFAGPTLDYDRPNPLP